MKATTITIGGARGRATIHKEQGQIVADVSTSDGTADTWHAYADDPGDKADLARGLHQLLEGPDGADAAVSDYLHILMLFAD